MKRCRTALTAGWLLVAALAGAQSIDKPAATIRLVSLDVISVRQLREVVDRLEAQTNRAISLEQRQEILGQLVDEKLIDQAAARDGIAVSAAEIDARINDLRVQNGAALNLDRPLTDEEFRQVVAQTGMSWQEYREQLGKALLQQLYITQTKAELFQSVRAPDDAAVRKFYEDNKTRLFIQPDLVLVKHIFIDSRQLTTDNARAQARSRADDIVRELDNGARFDDLIVRYSDDGASRYSGGILANSYLSREDPAAVELVGRAFLDAVFELQEGQRSGVLQSNLGLHVVQVAERVPARILALDDPVQPGQSATVEQQIRSLLIQNAQTQAYERAATELLAELKEEATVRVFSENLDWEG